MRFGNSAFRTFCKKMYPINRKLSTDIADKLDLVALKKNVEELKNQNKQIDFVSDEIREVVIEELSTYLDESFGNEVNIYIYWG